MKINEKQYKCNFEALQCDKNINKFMNAFDPTMQGVGIKVIISFTTTTEPTQEYISKMEKDIENIPDDKVCLMGVKFKNCELLI